jgi:UDP-N-acetylglucosamine--N-acetylmuramyl-(pentapeptide) pyrophosphoryl-undecaprenol N-acetylglucosamine transferase
MVSGGTGGHIFPALAVAEKLRARSELGAFPCTIEFVGTRRPLESKIIPAAGYPLRTVHAAGLKGIGGLRFFRNLLVLPRTTFAVRRILKEFKPQVVVGVGGYLAGPVMLMAALRGIPTLLIEPNVRPGFTNRVLAPVVRKAAVGFEATAQFYGKKANVTGLPVRSAFFSLPPHQRVTQAPEPVNGAAQPGVAVPPFTVLIVGGSQGSRAINQAVVASLPLLAQINDLRSALKLANDVAPTLRSAAASLKPGAKPGATSTVREGIRIIHQTGEADYNEVLKSYQGQSLRAEVHAFIEDMPGVISQADLVISRAGATAVTELAAAGRAALLIPFPGAADQHQLENARAMEKAGAARVIVQSELTPERLAAEIGSLMANPEALDKMATNARSFAKLDAAARIADLVQELAIS